MTGRSQGSRPRLGRRQDFLRCRATPAYVGGIRRVASRAWTAAHEPIVGTETVERFLAEYYDPDSVEEYVHTTDDVLGFALARPVEDGFALSWCYVDPDRWGKGVGRRLLDAIETRVAAAGGERVDTFHDEAIDADSYTYEKSLDGA